MATSTRALICALSIMLMVPSSMAQTDPQAPRAAPMVSGKLIDTDGVRKLSIAYQQDSRAKIFTGTIHALCVIPASSSSEIGTSLPLFQIPTGTEITLFYIPRRSVNIVLAIRLDHVRGKGSRLPEGVSIPCVQAAQQSRR